MSTKDSLGDHAEKGLGRSLVERVAQEILSEPFMRLGWEIGNTPVVDRILDKLEAAVGPRIAGMAITSTAEFAKVMGPIRAALISKGVPPLVMVAVNGIIEQAAQGIWARRQAEGVHPTTPLTAEEVKAGFGHARSGVREKAHQQQEVYMKILGEMEPTKREAFFSRVEALTPQQRAMYSLYIPNLTEPSSKWLVEELADLESSRWIARLEVVFGEKKIPITAQITTAIGNAISGVRTALAVLPREERARKHKERMDKRAAKRAPVPNPQQNP